MALRLTSMLCCADRRHRDGGARALEPEGAGGGRARRLQRVNKGGVRGPAAQRDAVVVGRALQRVAARWGACLYCLWGCVKTQASRVGCLLGNSNVRIGTSESDMPISFQPWRCFTWFCILLHINLLALRTCRCACILQACKFVLTNLHECLVKMHLYWTLPAYLLEHARGLVRWKRCVMHSCCVSEMHGTWQLTACWRLFLHDHKPGNLQLFRFKFFFCSLGERPLG